MKRKLAAFLVAAAVTIPMGGPARADAQPCNPKAIAHTAKHLERTDNPVRIRILTARYERLRNRCFAVPHH